VEVTTPPATTGGGAITVIDVGGTGSAGIATVTMTALEADVARFEVPP
jgi:hypothetical protein